MRQHDTLNVANVCAADRHRDPPSAVGPRTDDGHSRLPTLLDQRDNDAAQNEAEHCEDRADDEDEDTELGKKRFWTIRWCIGRRQRRWRRGW